MCAVITGMVPYDQIDLDAPFAQAFASKGLGWAAGIVSAGALTGITTSLLVSLLGQPRIYMTMARDGLLPAWFGRLHATRGTPVNAQLFTGACAGLLALIVDIDALAQLVSIGTLCVFCFVCAAVLARRYCPAEGPGWRPVLLRVAGLVGCGLAFAFCTVLLSGAQLVLATPFAGAFLAITASFTRLPQLLRPKRFAVPLLPWTPALGMYATLQLIASLGPVAWIRFVVYYALCTGVYCLYRGGADPVLAEAQAASAAAALSVGVGSEEGGERGGDAEAGPPKEGGLELTQVPAPAVKRRAGGPTSDGSLSEEEDAALGPAARHAAEKRAAKMGLLSSTDAS